MRQIFEALAFLAILLVGVGAVAASVVVWLSRRRSNRRARRRKRHRINLFRE